MSKDPELHFSEFAAAGEEQVRRNVAGKVYGQPDGWKARMAEEWLRQRNAERIDASNSTQIDLQRRSTEAAESAASSARKANRIAKNANTIAKTAVIIAIVAIAMSIIGLVAGQGP